MRESFESSRKAIAEEKGGKNLNKMERELQIVISASRRITLQSPPYSQNKRLKAYGASSTVRLYPASVGAETKNMSTRQICFYYFPLIVTHIHNIPWPREHLLLYNIAFAVAPISTESLVSVRFKLLVSDHFIPFSDWSKQSDSFLAR